jgi:dephospho-CoA kinase
MASPLRIALTGGIGSGKSTVAEAFARRGVAISDADRISHQLTAAGGAAMAEICAVFGPRCCLASGALDRTWMRERVFADSTARAELEAILHPRIRQQMLAETAQAPGSYCLLVIPLLFETGQQHIVDRVLVVDVPEALQIERVRARDGLDEVSIRRILASQVEREQRLAGADDVIDNSALPATLEPRIEALHQHYCTLSARNAYPFGDCGGGRSP